MVKKSILITLLSFLVTILSFTNQLVIANYFGANVEMDTYIYASNLPFLISAIITSSLGYSLTPYLIKQKIMMNSNYSSFLGNLLQKLLFYVVIIYFILISLFTYLYSKNFEINNIKTILFVFIISCILSLLNILQSFFNSIFNSESNFYYPVYLSFLPYLFALLSVILFHHNFGSISISIGLFFGSLSSLIISYKFLYKKIDFNSNNSSIELKSINKFLNKLPVVAIAMLCFSVYQTIDSFWAPQLGMSNLSYLGYCQRLLIALGALVITGPSTILIPRLTISIEEGRNNDFLMDLILVIKLVIALASMVALIGSFISKEVIFLLFERGAFKIKDTLGVANILPFMLTGMIFMLCVVMLFRAFFTINFKSDVVILGILTTFFYFILSGIGSKYLGIKGIALSYILTWMFTFLISLYMIFKENIYLLINQKNLFFILKLIINLILVAIFILFTRSFLHKFHYVTVFSKNLIITIFTGTVGLFIYFISSVFVIKIEEIILLFKNISTYKKPS